MKIICLFLFMVTSFAAQAGEFHFFNSNLSVSSGISVNRDGKVITDSSWKVTSDKDDLVVYTDKNKPSEDPFGLLKDTLGIYKKNGEIEKIATAGSLATAMAGFKDKKMIWNINCAPRCTVTSRKICEFYMRKTNAKSWEEAEAALNKCINIAAEFPADIKQEYDQIVSTYSLDSQKIRNVLGRAAGRAGIGVSTKAPQQEDTRQLTSIAKAIQECSKMPYGQLDVNKGQAEKNDASTGQ